MCTFINPSPGAKRPRKQALKCETCGSERAFPDNGDAVRAVDAALAAEAASAAPEPPRDAPLYRVVRVLRPLNGRESGSPETLPVEALERLPSIAAAVAAAAKAADSAADAAGSGPAAAPPRMVLNARVVLSRCGPLSDSSRCLGSRVHGIVGTIKEIKGGRFRVRRVGVASSSADDWYYASEVMLESEACAELAALRATAVAAAPASVSSQALLDALGVAILGDASAPAVTAAPEEAHAASPPPPPSSAPLLSRALSAAYAEEKTFVEVMALPDLLRR